MQIEEQAYRYTIKHPDATIEQAFLDGYLLANKNVKGVDNLEQRKDRFKDEVLLYRSQYNGTMLKEFFEYWTESGGRKMRFEKEKTFEVSKRLTRWANNCKGNYAKRNSIKPEATVFDAADFILQKNQQ